MKTNEQRLTKLIQKMRDEGEWPELYTMVAKFLHAEIVDGMYETEKDVKAMKRIIKRLSTAQEWEEFKRVYG